LVVFIRGQSLTPTVIATTGGYSIGSSNTLSFTAGETITPTLSNGMHILTQGFQQPDRDLTASVEKISSWSAQAFPNPAESVINIHLQNCQSQTFTWQIVDTKGSSIVTSSNPFMVDGETTFQVSVEQLVPATYMLLLTNDDFQTYTIKFIKN
jgi:hypothetical protein